LLPLCCALLSLPACELVASFDQSKLDQNRTLGPTPLPTLDGAVAVVPDGSLRFDGALVRDDTGVPSPGDAATDAARDASADDASDGQLPDADVLDAAVDAGASDAGNAGDAGDLDAAPADAGPRDAGLAPDLFADV
jgi:hypothetical protein